MDEMHKDGWLKDILFIGMLLDQVVETKHLVVISLCLGDKVGSVDIPKRLRVCRFELVHVPRVGMVKVTANSNRL